MLLSSQFLPFAEYRNIALKKGMAIFHPWNLKRGNFWGKDKIVKPSLVSSVHAAESKVHETRGGWKQRLIFTGDFVYSMHAYRCFDWSSLKNESKMHARQWKIGTLTTVKLESALCVRQAIVFSLFGNWCHCSLLRTVPLGGNDTDIIHTETARLMPVRQQSVQVHWKEYNTFAKIKSLTVHRGSRSERNVPLPNVYSCISAS